MKKHTHQYENDKVAALLMSFTVATGNILFDYSRYKIILIPPWCGQEYDSTFQADGFAPLSLKSRNTVW